MHQFTKFDAFKKSRDHGEVLFKHIVVICMFCDEPTEKIVKTKHAHIWKS